MHLTTSRIFSDKGSVTIIFILMVLSACATPEYHNQKKGIVVADFYADKVGSILELVEKTHPTRAVAVIEITPLDNFRVLELPVGEYTWRQLREPDRITPLYGRFDISVQADSINYIGSMLIKSYPKAPQISVVNQATQVLQRLQKDYQATAQRFPFMLQLMRQH